MTLNFLNNSFKKLQNVYLISIVIVNLIFLDVFQDFIYAKIYNKGFYFSESFIFKSFWVFLIPFTFLISFFAQKKSLKFDVFLIIKIPLISLLHITISALLIVGLYALVLNIDFLFLDVFKGLLSTKLYLSLLIFGIITFKKENKPKNKKTTFLSIKNGRTIHNITLDKVLFVEANTPYVTLITKNKKYCYNSSLTKFLLRIDNPNFIRIHKKYIVNKDFIVELNSRLNGDYDVVLKNNQKIRLSRTYRKNLFLQISKDSINTK